MRSFVLPLKFNIHESSRYFVRDSRAKHWTWIHSVFDFLMARPTQRHACKIRCLANLCRLSCVQRETSNWFQNFPRTYSSVKRQHFLSEVEVSLLNSFKEESSQKSTKWDNCLDLLHKRHGSCCKTTQSSLTKCLPVSVKPKYLLQFTKYLFQLKTVFSKWHVQWLVAGVHNLKEVSISIIRRFQSMRLLQITKYLFQKNFFSSKWHVQWLVARVERNLNQHNKKVAVNAQCSFKDTAGNNSQQSS